MTRLWFLAWTLVGSAWALTFLGAMTIGIFILPIVITATVLLGRHHVARRSAVAAISGIGLPFFYVVYLNRAGPGMICTANANGGETCGAQMSPWPWMMIGLAFVVGGAFVAIRRAYTQTWNS